jgi:pimeloyl-ACP methyl ester carboxylesterase
MNSLSSAAAHYEIIDAAPPGAACIALVHGVSQDHRLFDRQVDLLKSEYRLIAIDLPGHGLSADLPGPFGLQEYADSIFGALHEGGIAHCHFWGTHLGAGAGLLLACREPTLFLSLILESPVFPGRRLPYVSEFLSRIATIATTKGMETAREVWWQEGGWFDVIRARPEECRALEHRAMVDDFGGAPWLDAGLVSRPMPAIDDRAAALPVPILIVNGEHDLVDFVEAADALQAILARCYRCAIPEAGGFPLWEFPETVNEVVRDFLRRVMT